MEVPLQRQSLPAASERAEREAEQVRLARAGDRGAFESLATDAMPRLLGAATRLLGRGYAAEEAVADALFRAWRGIDRFEGTAAFSTWLHRIVCRVAVDQFRARDRDLRLRAAALEHETGAPRSRPEGASERLEANDLKQRLLAATHALPQTQRMVLLLVAWEGLALADAARVMDLGYATAKSNLHHARRALRGAFETGVDA